MIEQDIIEVLEATATNSKAGNFSNLNANTSYRDIQNYKNSIMRFLEELDAEITVGELRGVLEEYYQ